MKLNEKQKQSLRNLHFGLMSKLSDDQYARFLIDGEIIEFVCPNFTSNNIELSIKNDLVRKIWFSQLSNFGILTEPDLSYGIAGLYMKDGKAFGIRTLEPKQFWNIVNGRSFRVETICKIEFVVDQRSTKMRAMTSLRNIDDVMCYIEECIDNDHVSDLNGILKRGTLYDLYEV